MHSSVEADRQVEALRQQSNKEISRADGYDKKWNQYERYRSSYLNRMVHQREKDDKSLKKSGQGSSKSYEEKSESKSKHKKEKKKKSKKEKKAKKAKQDEMAAKRAAMMADAVDHQAKRGVYEIISYESFFFNISGPYML